MNRPASLILALSLAWIGGTAWVGFAAHNQSEARLAPGRSADAGRRAACAVTIANDPLGTGKAVTDCLSSPGSSQDEQESVAGWTALGKGALLALLPIPFLALGIWYATRWLRRRAGARTAAQAELP